MNPFVLLVLGLLGLGVVFYLYRSGFFGGKGRDEYLEREKAVGRVASRLGFEHTPRVGLNDSVPMLLEMGHFRHTACTDIPIDQLRALSGEKERQMSAHMGNQRTLPMTNRLSGTHVDRPFLLFDYFGQVAPGSAEAPHGTRVRETTVMFTIPGQRRGKLLLGAGNRYFLEQGAAALDLKPVDFSNAPTFAQQYAVWAGDEGGARNALDPTRLQFMESNAARFQGYAVYGINHRVFVFPPNALVGPDGLEQFIADGQALASLFER